MGKFIPVDPDRWAELVKAAGERDAFVFEIARLKADLAKSEEHNDALCESMVDLNSELFAASNINEKLHMERVRDLNQMGGQCEDIARLNSLIANSEQKVARLQAKLDAFLVKYEEALAAGDALAYAARHQMAYETELENWRAAKPPTPPHIPQ